MLFFTLLMLLTGQHDLFLLYTSVLEVSNTVYLKAWMIGSFLLACCSALLLGGYRTKIYLLGLWIQNRSMHFTQNKSDPDQYFLIEELPDDPEKVPDRHRELESILDSGVRDTDDK